MTYSDRLTGASPCETGWEAIMFVALSTATLQNPFRQALAF